MMERRSEFETKRASRSTARVEAAPRRFPTGLPAAVFVAGAMGCRPEVDRPSLLAFLTVDTRRADRLAAVGAKRGLTPSIDALADERIVFTSTYAPSSFALPSDREMLRALGYTRESPHAEAQLR